MVRLFVAIPIPDEIEASVIDLQKVLGTMPLRMKPIEKKNLHITLSFLGEFQYDRVEEISKKLDETCKGYRKFTVKVSKGMLIPSEDHIRVIGLGVENSNGLLESMRKSIFDKFGGDSKPVHLIVGRVREVSDKKYVSEFVNSVNIDKYFEVDSVLLIKSFLKKSGPRYKVVHESKLV